MNNELSNETKLRKKEILSWIIPISIVLVLSLLIRIFIGGTTYVSGISMEPTLENGDVLLINKISHFTHNYHRQDIVTIDAPDRSGEQYIKRIIGLPGETIELKDGAFYIDGKKMIEYYVSNTVTYPYNETKWVLKKDEYFVVGDNRNVGASKDSRIFGPVSVNHIESKAFFRLWPLKKFGSLN